MHDRPLNLLICSPTRYNCATPAPMMTSNTVHYLDLRISYDQHPLCPRPLAKKIPPYRPCGTRYYHTDKLQMNVPCAAQGHALITAFPKYSVTMLNLLSTCSHSY